MTKIIFSERAFSKKNNRKNSHQVTKAQSCTKRGLITKIAMITYNNRNRRLQSLNIKKGG
jgi:hypothetical protein